MKSRTILYIVLILFVLVSGGFGGVYAVFDDLDKGVSNSLKCGEWVEAEFAGGAGTASDPYRIENFVHLNNVRNHLSAHYVLVNDLDSQSEGYTKYASSQANGGKGWEPIGCSERFTGFFNGNGKKISDLYINRPGQDNVGLFGYVGVSQNNAPTEIKDLLLLNVDITGGEATGALAGRVTGNPQTVIKFAGVLGGTVRGNGSVGGLLGVFDSFALNPPGQDTHPRLSNSFAQVNVYGETEYVGGLVGVSRKGLICDCYTRSVVYAQNAVYVGGLAGGMFSRATLRYSYAATTVHAQNCSTVGGIIGWLDSNSNPVTNSYLDMQLCGCSKPIGNGVNSHIVMLNSSQMKGNAAITYMHSLNFIQNWQTVDNDYPVLRNFCY